MYRKMTRFVKSRSPVVLLGIILLSTPVNAVHAGATQYDTQFAKAYPSIWLLTAVLFSVSGSGTHVGAGQGKSQPSFTVSPTGTTIVTFEERTTPGRPESFASESKPGDVTLPEVVVDSQGDFYSPVPAISSISNGPVIGVDLNVPSASMNQTESRESISNAISNATVALADGMIISFPAPGIVVSDPFQPGQPDPSLAPVPEPGEFATAFALFGTTAVGMVTARLKARRRKSIAPVAAA